MERRNEKEKEGESMEEKETVRKKDGVRSCRKTDERKKRTKDSLQQRY
jgi:hypothetical protein